jgi:hypothetical protein
MPPVNPVRGLIHTGDTKISPRSRLELAFLLSSAVVRLSPTPWVDPSWQWDEWRISFGQTGNLSHTSIPRILYSTKLSVERKPQQRASWRILVRDPVLARLGISIIEIILGCSLAEVRQDHPGFLHDGVTQLDPMALDILTAKKILALRWIRDEASINIEHAVSACINQQYWDTQSGSVREIETRDPSYLRRVVSVVVAPLDKELRQYFRYGTSLSSIVRCHR